MHYKLYTTSSFGETTTHLHADNCMGQNYMLQYLMWRTLGPATDITLSFLLVAYKICQTFGLFKQLYRRTKVSCIDEIAAVANASATVNVAQLVGTQEA